MFRVRNAWLLAGVAWLSLTVAMRRRRFQFPLRGEAEAVEEAAAGPGWNRTRCLICEPTVRPSWSWSKHALNVPLLTQRDATLRPAIWRTPTKGFFGFSTPRLLQAPPQPTQPANGTYDETLESSPNPPQWGEAQRERPPRTAICGGPVYWQKL